MANTHFLGTYALHAACDSGCMPVLQYLVEDLKIDVNKADTLRGFSPAMHAVLYGNLPALRFLVDHGADLHYQHKGMSLFHSAAEGGMNFRSFCQLMCACYIVFRKCFSYLSQHFKFSALNYVKCSVCSLCIIVCKHCISQLIHASSIRILFFMCFVLVTEAITFSFALKGKKSYSFLFSVTKSCLFCRYNS